MTALEILTRLLEVIDATSEGPDPCRSWGYHACIQLDGIHEAAEEARNELDRARLITRDITEAA